jgi:hypothetical protein
MGKAEETAARLARRDEVKRLILVEVRHQDVADSP